MLFTSRGLERKYRTMSEEVSAACPCKPGMRRRLLQLVPPLSSSSSSSSSTCTDCNRRRRRRPVSITPSSTLLSLLALSSSCHHHRATPTIVAATAAAESSSPADFPIMRERRRRNQQQHYYSQSRQLHHHQQQRHHHHHRMQQQQHLQPQPQQLRQMKQDDYKNLCKETESGYLYPGDTLSRGEFLCRGDLRFGIDATHGYFMVGFVNWTELAMIASSSNSTATGTDTITEEEEEKEDGVNANTKQRMVEESTDTTSSSSAPLWDVITPTAQAWRATPTTLFTPTTQAFSYLNLTEYGNILGYDDEGNEIYDSNYDDDNRLGSKRGNSRLSISGKCINVASMDVDEGELCVKLTSPPRAGMPYGTDTWGIRVYPELIVPVEPSTPPSMAPSTTMKPSSVSPTSITPTISSIPPVSASTVDLDDVAQTPSFIPTYDSSTLGSSTSSPSLFGTISGSVSSSNSSSSSTLPGYNIVDDSPTFHPSHNLNEEEEETADSIFGESNGETAHIWGKVWFDSNRNGEINVGETTVNGFGVTVFECSEEDETNGEDANNYKGSGSIEVTRLITEEGMFFHEVPTGKTYQLHFDSNPDEYGFSSGVDTGTDESGWSECKSTKDGNVQWNAGLYFLNDTSYEDESTKASIGGHIYLDVNENGIMEPVERTAAVGGYTVNNAKMVVSLTNCTTNEVIETLEKRFPCTYSFGNLTEGSYKLRYEIQALTRVNTPNAISLYSIVDNDGNNSSEYETACGKLGDGEDIDSGDVGVRTLMAITPYAAESPFDPLAYEDAGASQKSAADEKASTLSSEGEDAASEGGSNSFVPALVGSIITLSIVAVSAAIFIRHRHGNLSSFPLLGSSKTESAAVRSVGSNRSSVDGDMNTQNTGIGSLIIDAGTAKGDDSIELGIRQLGTTLNSTLDELPEEESVGFEVYDDEDDGLQGSIDYGPVISDMIAKFSQKQGSGEEAINAGDERDTGSAQIHSSQQGTHEDRCGVTTSPGRPKKYSPQRHQRRDNRDSNASAEMNRTDAQHHNLQYQSVHHASQYPGNVTASNIEMGPGNSQSYINEIYDESQYQYNASGYTAQDNGGASRSTDPPAASYRDIPAPHVGWNRDIQLVGDIRQYETPTQYVAGNGVPVATYSSTSNDGVSHQMMNQDTHSEYISVVSSNSIPNSESSGHGSTSGWSGFSSTANSLAVAGISSPFRRSYKGTASSKARSRRSQSNPRDGQLSERWRHKDETPANSTVEYNTYSTPSAVSADDDRTALSLGSDQSSDPPGASYMNLTHVPPPVPPHRMTPPRKFSPNNSPIPRQDGSYPSPPPRTYPSPPVPLR